MKILCLANRVPWPAMSGGTMRLATTVEALTSVGDVDLFIAVAPPPTLPPPVLASPLNGVRRIAAAEAPAPHSWSSIATRWTMGRQPRPVLRHDSDEARRMLRDWADPTYDLVWVGPDVASSALVGVVDSPTIVDLDNLMDHWLRHRRVAMARDRVSGHRRGYLVRPSWRERVTAVLDHRDEMRWAARQRALAGAVDAVVVCSELDRARIGVDNAVVIPNGYELVGDPPKPRSRPGHSPRFALVGLMSYLPNLDAAWFFAEDVLRRVRAVEPTAEFWIIGHYDERVRPLGSLPGVVLRGQVDDVTSELAEIDTVVVPLRFGGGTRIKILEAFANRIPVVTTTVGAEGLGVVSGRHALVADEADAMAAACIETIRDDDLCRRLTDAGFELFISGYRASDVRQSIVTLATSVTGKATWAKATS